MRQEMMGFGDGSGISWTIMQTICTSLQTDNHTNNSVFTGRMLFLAPNQQRDFCQTNYLNIYSTDLHEICSIGRTLAVDERPEVIFSIPQGTLPWQPIL